MKNRLEKTVKIKFRKKSIKNSQILYKKIKKRKVIDLKNLSEEST